MTIGGLVGATGSRTGGNPGDHKSRQLAGLPPVRAHLALSYRIIMSSQQIYRTPMDPGTLFGFTGFIISFVGYFQSARSADASAASAHHADRAATSAEDAAASARRANDLEQHKDRLGIYKKLQKFHGVVVTRGVGFPEEEIWPMGDAANLSEFYYPRKDYLALEAIVSKAISTKGLYDNYRGYRELGQGVEAKDAAVVMNESFSQLRAMCKAADEALRARLRLEASSESNDAE